MNNTAKQKYIVNNLWVKWVVYLINAWNPYFIRAARG